MKRYINDIKKFYKYCLYSARSELKTEVANSFLNWVWWVLEPLSEMLIYVLVFSVIFSNNKAFFPIFVYEGLTFWGFFNRNLQASVKMIQSNKSIISKVYVPKFILLLSKMFVNGFKMMISFGIIIVMMVVTKVFALGNTPLVITWHIFEVIPLLILLFVLTYAFSSVLLHLGVYVEDMHYVIQIALRLVFYLTGIFFDINEKLMQKHEALAILLGKVNPMAYIITQVRNCTLYQTGIDWKLYAIWMGISLLIAVFGTWVIYKNENNYIKVV